MGYPAIVHLDLLCRQARYVPLGEPGGVLFGWTPFLQIPQALLLICGGLLHVGGKALHPPMFFAHPPTLFTAAFGNGVPKKLPLRQAAPSRRRANALQSPP